jgi:hypothetical protein
MGRLWGVRLDNAPWRRPPPLSGSSSAGAVAATTGGAEVLRAAAKKAASSSGDPPSARTRRVTVSRRGVRLSPRSRSAMPRALSPARAASSSCVKPAARRRRRSNAPNPSPASSPIATTPFGTHDGGWPYTNRCVARSICPHDSTQLPKCVGDCVGGSVVCVWNLAQRSGTLESSKPTATNESARASIASSK